MSFPTRVDPVGGFGDTRRMKLFAQKRDESEFVEYGFGLVNEVGIDRVTTEDSTLVDLYYWSEGVREPLREVRYFKVTD